MTTAGTICPAFFQLPHFDLHNTKLTFIAQGHVHYPRSRFGWATPCVHNQVNCMSCCSMCLIPELIDTSGLGEIFCSIIAGEPL